MSVSAGPYCAAGFRCFVHSRNKTTGISSSQFKVVCQLPRLESKHQFNRVTVCSFAATKSYQLVTNGANTFTLTEGAQSATITIPRGNYSLRAWKRRLTALLTAGSPNGWTYTVTSPNPSIEADTGENTITVTGNAGVQPSITVGAYLYKQLGFNKNTTNTFSGSSLVSTNVCIFQAEPAIFLHSDAVAQDGDDILAIVTGVVSTPSGGYVNFQSQHPQLSSRRFSEKAGNLFEFSVQNFDGQVLDFRGGEFVFDLLFWHDTSGHNEMKDDGFEVINNVPKLPQLGNAAPEPAQPLETPEVTNIPPLRLPA